MHEDIQSNKILVKKPKRRAVKKEPIAMFDPKNITRHFMTPQMKQKLDRNVRIALLILNRIPSSSMSRGASWLG